MKAFRVTTNEIPAADNPKTNVFIVVAENSEEVSLHIQADHGNNVFEIMITEWGEGRYVHNGILYPEG